uniref:C2H2-type domain-containing protein n=1 Tax=Glossina brevipalpis TaxID=37001 RepID=A0A1A9WXA7_9MUSC
MLHEALMLEIYRQALNAGALPTARPRSTDSANSSERCPSHESNSSENGKEARENAVSNAAAAAAAAAAVAGVLPLPTSPNATFPTLPNIPAQPPSMEAYLHMIAAAQQYGFPLGATTGPRLPLPTESSASFKLPPQASPTASSNNSEALDFRTNLFDRSASAEPPGSDEDEEEDNTDNPLDLSVGTRKRLADDAAEPDSTIGQIQVKKIFKSDSPPMSAHPAPTAANQVPTASMLPSVNPYLAAVAAANIFRAGQFPDWNGKSDLVVDPLEKISDIVKGPRKEKPTRPSGPSGSTTAGMNPVAPPPPVPTSTAAPLPASNEGITKTRHNIWQSHWQNKGVASSVFRCVWCKQSFATLEALTAHMKDSKHCGVNVPPFGNLPTAADRTPISSAQTPPGGQGHMRQSSSKSNANAPSAAAKNAFQYRGDPPTPLPRKLVRGQNVWLGKGVEQAMQILKCMRCGESFRSLSEMTKHMQETQHYTNILSQEQTISMKSSGTTGDNKDGQNSLSSEESRTLSAVLTCKVCDKAFNSLGDLSNHMAKNNHYAEPLMQSMAGAGNRKRPAPKKREKSLPVRKLLEMKGAQIEQDHQEMDMKLQRPGLGPSPDKTEAALFAERMHQFISSVKTAGENAKANLSVNNLISKTKSPEIMEPKNGASKSTTGTSSVLSAIEQMFTTSFDTPPRHATLPASSPSNSSTKNTSPVASSILKRLGIDENVDYNKPLIDTTDPYFQHYRYTSSERSASECSAETHVETRKLENPTPEKMYIEEPSSHKTTDYGLEIKKEPGADKMFGEILQTEDIGIGEHVPKIKMEIKSEVDEDEEHKSPKVKINDITANGTDYSNNNAKECKEISPVPRTLPPRSPTDSHRSITPKSPASSIKSYDGGEKKYPSDSLNALSSMFDSLGSNASSSTSIGNRNSTATSSMLSSSKVDSPDNLSTSNSLAALRQFCIKKEKTA